MGIYNYRQFGRAAVVTPSNTDKIPSVSGGSNGGNCLYIGGTGNVAVQTEGGDLVTFYGVPAGTILQVKVIQVLSTGTTATNILALW
ncbi:MAG: hypothetical protein RIR01_2085 [Bacteroidota bacterium]|jgi:hypothetical protein